MTRWLFVLMWGVALVGCGQSTAPSPTTSASEKKVPEAPSTTPSAVQAPKPVTPSAKAPPDWSPSAAAMRAFFEEVCPGAKLERRERGYGCTGSEGRTVGVEVRTGHYLRKNEQEALLAVRDSAKPETGGYLVLMRETRNGWRKVRTFDALSPGNGWLRFQATMVDEDSGLSRPVLCQQTCAKECCEGRCVLLRFISNAGELSSVTTTLTTIGRSDALKVEVVRNGFKDLDGDGRGDLVLHRRSTPKRGEARVEKLEFRFDGQDLKPLSNTTKPFVCAKSMP